MLKSLPPWAQVLVLIACIVAPIVAYKILASDVAALALMGVGMLLNFHLGRSASPALSEAPSGPPDLKVLTGGRSDAEE